MALIAAILVKVARKAAALSPGRVGLVGCSSVYWSPCDDDVREDVWEQLVAQADDELKVFIADWRNPTQFRPRSVKDTR